MTDVVSIILPVYNAASFIEPVLDSLLTQTYPHIEIIIVDEGSTDSTFDIIQQKISGHPKVKSVRQENGDPSAVRNTAL